MRLGIWAGTSVFAGTLLLLLFQRRPAAAFLRHFAIQLLAWGVINGALAWWAWNGLALRDFAAATQLQNFLWLNVGLDAGYVGVGLTLAITSWVLGKRPGGLGAGVGVVVQGLALLFLDIRLLTLIDSARLAAVPIRATGWIPT